ncbi:hypothetical protein BLNAU_12922 [Blattamonas nauphoetae]|uniref:RRM domain-containing protein n=1 Tax=Blattamonas nauphoetae TaxID=2049346 RepID=A0ABQ9XHZ8_9EUKA|nr:hypothetical protein BLNAU_12922 [Blattamonas nauphoetae]
MSDHDNTLNPPRLTTMTITVPSIVNVISPPPLEVEEPKPEPSVAGEKTTKRSFPPRPRKPNPIGDILRRFNHISQFIQFITSEEYSHFGPQTIALTPNPKRAYVRHKLHKYGPVMTVKEFQETPTVIVIAFQTRAAADRAIGGETGREWKGVPISLRRGDEFLPPRYSRN